MDVGIVNNNYLAKKNEVEMDFENTTTKTKATAKTALKQQNVISERR